MLQYELTVEQRKKEGKHALKELKRNNFIPAIVYGHKEKPTMVSIKESDLLKMFHTIGRENAMINLKIGDKEITTIVKEIQRNPRTNKINHVDFLVLHKGEKIKVNVPIKIVGAAEGVKEGGVMEQLLRDIEVRCTPSQIPDHFEIDITHLKIGESIHVKDINFEDGEFITHPEETLITIIAPRTAKTETEEAEETADEPKEPEVIGEKKEEAESK